MIHQWSGRVVSESIIEFRSCWSVSTINSIWTQWFSSFSGGGRRNITQSQCWLPLIHTVCDWYHLPIMPPIMEKPASKLSVRTDACGRHLFIFYRLTSSLPCVEEVHIAARRVGSHNTHRILSEFITHEGQHVQMMWVMMLNEDSFNDSIYFAESYRVMMINATGWRSIMHRCPAIKEFDNCSLPIRSRTAFCHVMEYWCHLFIQIECEDSFPWSSVNDHAVTISHQ